MIVLFQEHEVKNILFSEEQNATGYLEDSPELESVVSARVPKEQKQRVEQACFRLVKQMHDGLRVAHLEKPVQRLVWTYQAMKKLSESFPETPINWHAPWASIYTKLSMQSFRQKLCKDIDIWCREGDQPEKSEEIKRQIADLFEQYEESQGSLCKQVSRVMEVCLPFLDPDWSGKEFTSQLVYSYAVSSHYARGVGEFLAECKDVNVRDSSQRTLLHWAVEAGDWEISAALLLAKAEVHIQDEQGNTPLHLAVACASKEVIELVLNAVDGGLDLPNQNGDTALHLAVRYGDLDTASQLLKKKALLDLLNQRGYSPLHIAIMKRNIDMTALLISCGANLNLQNQNGLAPLHIAATKGFEEIVDRLIQAGADVNLQTMQGSSPLHLASYHGRADVIRLLLATPGINTTMIGTMGQTSLNLSLLSGSPAAAWELFTLENYMAEVIKPFASFSL